MLYTFDITGTSEKDWTVEKVSTVEAIDSVKVKANAGDMSAVMELLYGAVFREGYGGDYDGTRMIVNKMLGLKDEDFEVTVREIVRDIEKSSI